jgi:N-methylhydantoinase A
MSDTRPGRSITLDDFKDLIKDFHKRHQTQFGYSDENMVTRITSIKLKAVGKPQQVAISEQPHVDEDPSKALKRSREVYFKELGGFTEIPCYDGDRLRNGNNVTGPAVIEEKTTTIVIPPGAAINVDRFGNYVGKLQ